MNRREFVTRAAAGAAGLLVLPSLSFAQATQPATDKPPQLASDLVREFVIAGHDNLDKVKSMLAEHPNLLYAMWDWGGGDFETAFEGAGHMGRKDIANFLISQGCRPNIFILTMLGQTKIVKAILEAYPHLLNAKGPHGLTLLHHAQKGEADAAELLEFISSKGLKETKVSMY
jgi:hypothetical protein